MENSRWQSLRYFLLWKSYKYMGEVVVVLLGASVSRKFVDSI